LKLGRKRERSGAEKLIQGKATRSQIRWSTRNENPKKFQCRGKGQGPQKRRKDLLKKSIRILRKGKGVNGGSTTRANTKRSRSRVPPYLGVGVPRNGESGRKEK